MWVYFKICCWLNYIGVIVVCELYLLQVNAPKGVRESKKNDTFDQL